MANKPVKLRIRDTLGSPVWVSTEDGQKVFDRISEAFKAGHAVDLSFANGGTMITAFLNAAIGQLYSGEYQEDFVQENLTFSDINPDDKAMLDRAIANAKKYFANRAKYDQAWKENTDAAEE